MFNFAKQRLNSLFLSGSSTYGESFNPAKDCSDIVDNVAKADDGFYWVSLNKTKPHKVFTFVEKKYVEFNLYSNFIHISVHDI